MQQLILILKLSKHPNILEQVGVFVVRCNAVQFWAMFSIILLRCDLAKIITTLHLIFTITYVVRWNLEFRQNHNRTTLHFCDHMFGAIYNMQFEADIFFKF